MQTALVCLFLCLLTSALSTPVPLPGRAAGNCVGHHRILLKGCNAKHGFYIFKYVYSFSTRRNQTQIKDQKEESDSHGVIPSHQLSEDKAAVAPEQGDNDSTDVMENRIGLKPEKHSTPAVGGVAHSPHPGTGMRARGGINIAGPTPASSEGSGDLDLVTEVNSSVSILPQVPGEAMAGNRSDVRNEDRGISVEGAMTAVRERTPAPGAGNEGSGEATIPGQRQREGIETGGAALTSITEKMENVQVDAEGMDEYAYMPDSGSVTVNRGKAGSIVGATSFTHISPEKDDEVNIFIGRANIHVGEQENSHAGATVGSKNDGISTAGTSSSMPITVIHNSDADDDIPDQSQLEVVATTGTPSHRDSTTTSPRDGYPTGDNQDGATIIEDVEGPVDPSSWRVTGDGSTIPMEAGIYENGDDEAKGDAQKLEKQRRIAATILHQGGDKETTATVPVLAKGVSIRLGTTVESPRVSEGDCTTALRMTGGHRAGQSALVGSTEVEPATLQPHREGQPGVGARVWLGGARQEKTLMMDKVLSPRSKAGSQASSGAQANVGDRVVDTIGRPHATQAGGSSAPQAGQAGHSMAVGEDWQRGQSSKTRVVVAGADDDHLPGHHGKRLRAEAPEAFTVLGHSRQLDQVKHANELHVHERSFYTLSGAAGGPRVPYIGLSSADSSQSSEGERDSHSHSDSQQTGLQPSGWSQVNL